MRWQVIYLIVSDNYIRNKSSSTIMQSYSYFSREHSRTFLFFYHVYHCVIVWCHFILNTFKTLLEFFSILTFVHSYAMKWSLHLSLTWNLRKRCSVVLWLKHKMILECFTWCSTSARDHNRQKQTCNKLKAKTAHLLFCWFKNILECKDMFLIKHFILNSWKNRCILGS